MAGAWAQARAAPEAAWAVDLERAVARYASRDERGRIWGAPSAGGRGQCLDCPQSAEPPSSRCRGCQVRLLGVMHPRMALEDLALVRAHLDARLAHLGCPRLRRDLAQRLELLYGAEAGGRLPPPLQAWLLEAVRASAASDGEAVARLTARVLRELARDGEAAQLGLHRQWLLGARRLLQAEG